MESFIPDLFTVSWRSGTIKSLNLTFPGSVIEGSVVVVLASGTISPTSISTLLFGVS